jgi:cytochrome c oxidase subunit II
MNTKRRRLFAAGAAAALAGASFAACVLAQPEEQVVRITARKFAFLPGEITLKKGIPVVLEFVSAEVMMGFNAPDLKVRADIIPGQVARVRLVPQQIGTFEYLCDIFCGDGHEGMHGTINVVA